MCLGRVPKSRRATSSLLLPASGGANGSSLLDKIRAESKNFVEENKSEHLVNAVHAHSKPRYSMQSTASETTTDDDYDNRSSKRASSLSTADWSIASLSIDESGPKSILKSASASTPKKTKEKSVQFGQVHTRSFNLRMGDTTNCPCLNHGPPLILCNTYVDRPPRRVSSFDAHCGSADPLSADQRRTILMERFGYTLREIMDGEHAIRVAKIHESKHNHRHHKMIPQVKLVKGIKAKLLAARAG